MRGSVKSCRKRVRPVTLSAPSFFGVALPMTASALTPGTRSPSDRLLVLTEHVLHRAVHLAQRRVGAHRLEDRLHEVAPASRGITEPPQRGADGRVVALAPNARKPGQLRLGHGRVERVELDVAIG